MKPYNELTLEEKANLSVDEFKEYVKREGITWNQWQEDISEYYGQREKEEEKEKRPVGRPIKFKDSPYHQKQREAQRRWYERHKEKIRSGEYVPTGKRMVYCPDCGRPFTSKTLLENHRIVEHGD